MLARLPDASARLEAAEAELAVVDVVPEPAEVVPVLVDEVPLVVVPLVLLAAGGGGGGPPSLKADRKLPTDALPVVVSLLRSDISCCKTSLMLLELSSRLEVVEAELEVVEDAPPAPPAPCMPPWWWWPPPPIADSAADAEVVPVVPAVIDMSPRAVCNCCRRLSRLLELSATLEVVDAELVEAVVLLVLPVLLPAPLTLPLSPEGGGGGPSPKLL